MLNDAEYDELLFLPAVIGYRSKNGDIIIRQYPEFKDDVTKYNDWTIKDAPFLKSAIICESIRHNKIDKILSEQWMRKKEFEIEYDICKLCKDKLIIAPVNGAL